MNGVVSRLHLTLAVVTLAIASTIGCAVGPNYKRPTVDVPGTYRGAQSEQQAASSDAQQPAESDAPVAQLSPQSSARSSSPSSSRSSSQSLGDEKWWEVFQDPELQSLIRTALKNNYDVRIAATRVLQAQAQVGITRANQLPTLSAGGNVTSQQSPQLGPIPAYELTQGQVAASAAWDLDFWGKYRRATEAARANLLANQWAQKEVMSTLVANLATAYFQLRQYDLELEISQNTLSSRRDSLKLTQTLEQHGINSLLDVRQSEQLVYTAATEVPDLERQIAQEENAISILLGKNPGDVPRGLKLTQQPHSPEVPAGIPSALLERRPDIHQAEANLIAANAQIGVARAAYFPDIALTATAGYQSPALTNLFTGPAGIWNMAASLTQPIFQGGRLKNNVRLAQAERDQMVLTYQQTIQGAFRDVSNALVAYRKDQETRAQQEHLLESARDAARLSQVRFNAGTTDYLEVLTNETNSFSAELALAQAQSNELIALVQLYQALGGGWE
ncbi:MAG TPA: efflux transporter outer membrane subunit [Terriglobales bacterium]|jgi:multidrug efflux system outer membrane protein|nr:efflux transporter outer membrane subunit [Terriglobales bacterium]